ncbi:redoxin domain-containing protein [Chitinophaga sp. SYP-B3965]|uniref:TlpA disulfide reductase family protein n=1 Tax=Chitinophaga sp. SYP-B3965 TaxID=2663120 RepID=UPI001299EFAC|nr:TlpA disulfide reductase family protein [Chitinophaga sp. SYP-B3965]MRG47972.1 redoxin domain-containing protein [Chitinophaga sp. SYP-B3965]
MRLTIALLLVISTRVAAQDNKDLSISINNKEEFTISGKIDGIGNAKVFLGNKPNGYSGAFKVRYFDSCMSVNDHFTFKGHVDELAFYSIEVPGKSKGWFYFIVENKEIKIVGNRDSLYRSTITGSPQSDTYIRYLKEVYAPLVLEVRVYHERVDSLRAAGDTAEMRRVSDEIIKPYNRRMEANMCRFVEEYPSNFGALAALKNFVNFIPLDTAKKYFLKLSDEIRQNPVGRKLKYRLFDYPELISKKKPMPNFSMRDTLGGIRRIAEFRGKYVLLDFWASWCGPCLDELPQVKRIDSLYGAKGLQVVGISLDTKKDLWKKAIIANGITWVNLSDLEGSDGKLYTLLNITYIPTKYLLDREGNIVLKEASLTAIEKFLEEVDE